MNIDAAPDTYCRKVEAYLCRKNGGHLVRIVGPAFERVCAWAARGVPLAVAMRGIDRYCDRQDAKGPRRRPARIEFCEADVLDVFDEWRRATGVVVGAAGAGEAGGASRAGSASDPVDASGPARGPSLPAHIDRVVARLTARRGGEERPLDALLDELIRELDAAKSGARGLRGEARIRFVEQLRAMDARLLEAARAICPPAVLQELAQEARVQLEAFRARMDPDACERAVDAALDRLIREHLRLPTISLD